jgi:GNAT superfamily N-acetyltransferase
VSRESPVASPDLGDHQRMTPQIEVRPLTGADDWEALDTGNPLAWQAPFWRSLTSVEIHWFVGLLGGRPVGLAAGCPLPYAAGGRGVGLVNVRPEARRHGVGTALLEAASAVVRGRLPGIQVSHVADHPDTDAAVAAWGLREVARHQESVLDLTTLDRAAFEARAAGTGVTIAPLPPFADMDDREWRDLHAFFAARYVEAPDAAGGGESLPYDEFRTMVRAPWMCATAVDDEGRYLGVTFVMDHPVEAGATNTFFTGVAAEARGRGIASALKCRQALRMADEGITRLSTQNMAGNEPILAANRRLGFVPDFVYVDVVRDL